MNRSIKKGSLLAVLILALTLSCGGGGSDDSPGETDNFDRAAMLANWADNIIVPGYDSYFETLDNFREARDRFVAVPSLENLNGLRQSWAASYRSWQTVSMFEIGPAETTLLRNYTNVFPTDPQEIEEHVASGTANLELPSTYDAQGFPAIDYMLHGVAGDDSGILDKLKETSYLNHLNQLIDRVWSLADQVRRGWRVDGYRDTFVSASGSSATSSVNKLVNDYMFYYEKALRAGKVGIPAGVFSGSPLSDRAEAPYHGELSQELLLIALSAADNFFRGRDSGISLQAYLDDLEVMKGERLLSQEINNQFASAQSAIQGLSLDLKTQVEMDNRLMLTAYDELQKLVVLLKVDMFQALNIQVDFVDADGD